MEEPRLLDVPITEQEHRNRDSSEYRHERSDVIEAAPQRYEPFRYSDQHLSDSSYVVKSPPVHQRIPSNFDDGPPKIVNFSQPTGYDRNATYSRVNYPPDLWKPFWIRRSTLIVLLVAFLMIIVALVLLWHFSNAQDGFAIGSSTTYYAWTYAPVAFMVLLVGIWRQVDYYFKLLGPWDELRKGPVRATQSLLLDYISPINFLSFTTAFKRGYTPVILSIIVFVSLKVAVGLDLYPSNTRLTSPLQTLFSAALLVPLPTVIMSNITSSVPTKVFDASSLALSPSSNLATFNSNPVYSVLGNLAYGMPFPPGVTSEYAYISTDISSFSSSDLENATYTAGSDILFPNLSCATLTVPIVGSAVVNANRTTVNTTSNSLQLRMPDGNVCDKWINPKIYAMNPQKELTPARQVEGTMQRVYCAGTGEGSQPLEPAGLLLTLTDIRYSQTIFPNRTIATSRRSIATMTNMLCIPGYYILAASLHNESALYGPGAVEIHISDVQNRTIDGLSKRNLAFLYDGIMNASQGIFGDRAQNNQASTIPNTVFNLMALSANTTDLANLLDPSIMQPAAESIFRRVMSYYAAESLTKPSTASMTVEAVYTKRKLHVSFVPFYVTIVAVALSALSTMILLIVTPPSLVPKDPSTIATSASILARSPELNRLLRNQIASKTAMVSALREHGFSSAIATTEHGHSSYKVIVTEVNPRHLRSSKEKRHNWWSPNFQLIPALAVAVLVPSTLIALLQYLQRWSDKNQGLATAVADPYTALYIRCIPVLVMLLVAAAVNLVDFQVELFSPWNKLAEGNANARSSLLSHLLGKLPPMALFESVRGRHIAAIFSILAAILASVFAIIGCGLYSVQTMTFTGTPITLTATDTFQMDNGYSALNDRGAAGVLRTISTTNASYPSGTFDELVFSKYNMASAANTSTSATNVTVGPFTATIPALRANLYCDVVPQANMDIKLMPATRAYNTTYYRIDSSYSLPEFCHYGGINRNSSIATYRNVFNVTSEDVTFYAGEMLDLVFRRNSSTTANSSDAAAGSLSAEGCPSLAFTFIETRQNGQTIVPTSLVCYQQIEQLKINVTYQMNSTEIDQSYEPVVLNGSVSLMTNPNTTSDAKSFDWRIQSNIERQLFGLGKSRLQSLDSATKYQFDAFFSYLFNATYQQDPATLYSIANTQKLIQQINIVYRKYMAQAINANMRVPVSGPQKRQSSTNPVQMTSNVLQPRVVQNQTSKLILQILLGITVLFCILAYLLTNFHLLLPNNPASIAGTMSLLAGSDLVWTPDDNAALCDCCGKPRRSSWSHEPKPEEQYPSPDIHNDYHLHPNSRIQTIPDGAEWFDHIKFAKVFRGKKYSLGWWREDRAKGRRRRFGIDIGAQPDDGEWELGKQRLRPKNENSHLEDLMIRGRHHIFGGDQRGQYHRTGSVDAGTALVHHASPPSFAPGFGPAPIPSPHIGSGERRSSPTLGMSPSVHEMMSTPPMMHGATPLLPPPVSSFEPGIMSPRKVRFDDEA